MTDRYERIRAALAMGPTPGPWKWWEEDAGYCCVNPLDGGLLIAKCDVRNPFDPEQRANAALIAACDPSTLRALIAERDALAAEVERLREVLKEADNELDWLDEGIDTPDHLVGGVCMRSYWIMRGNMKAALSKENGNVNEEQPNDAHSHHSF